MPHFLPDSCLRFASEDFDWYRFDETLPCARDHEAAEAVKAFMKAAPAERESAAAAVDVYSANTLVSFAERCASWALTEGEPTFVPLGLAAVGWQWQQCEDPCDGIAVMAALYDAASRLGLSVDQTFATAQAAAPQAVGQAFADFLTRTDLHEIGQVMGYVVRQDGKIFRYLRSW